ncbi:Protein CBG25957 [Caenorhabditis briggsae]|uniref:Protein CBG25957 n=1 Tax=Caenorhabditis briggsae TaxID=6238 RepID=B6IHE0_CAEBR|nr:Protein CBG25957 [Caenorhabditis briggsae]CAR99320.1 Protein CBG25957 [Caenorhabditis briggsae]
MEINRAENGEHISLHEKGGNDLCWGADTIRPHQYTDKTTASSLLPRSKKQSLKTTDQKWKGLSEQPNKNKMLLSHEKTL